MNIKAIFSKVKDSAAKVGSKAVHFVKDTAVRVKKWFADTFVRRSTAMLCTARGENFVDSGIKILIAVVIGALLLGGLYALFGDTILPTLTEKVEEMFDFAG